MTFRTLILASLRRHWRAHVGVLLGATLGSAVLVGALVVGDSVRGTLRDLGLRRLAGHAFLLDSGDRFYRQELFTPLEPGHTLAGRVEPAPGVDPSNLELTSGAVSMLHLPGTIARQDRTARANQVHVYGVPIGSFFRPPPPEAPGAATSPEAARRLVEQEARANPPPGMVILNEALASQLHARPGDELVLRIHRPSALSADAVIAPRDDQSLALRVAVHSVAGPADGGDLGLASSQVAPLNAFLRLDELDQAAGLPGLVNMTLVPPLVEREPPAGVARLWWQAVVQVRGWLHGEPASAGGDSRREAPDALLVPALNGSIANLWSLPDAGLSLRPLPPGAEGWELSSRRIFLEDPVVEAALRPPRSNRWHPSPQGIPAGGVPPPLPILTYLVNELRSDAGGAAPYSMVTAAGAPWVPADLADDEVVVTDWLAEDLKAGPGDALSMTYYLLDTGSQLVERTNRFWIRSVVKLEGRYADPSLMPEFPGLAKAESTRDWDAGFKLVHPIRPKDEAYWKERRGTPKAYISLAAGQKIWANRFGRVTAIRYPASPAVPASTLRESVEASVLSNLDPARVGLRFQPARGEALRAASQGQDFGGLFIGFSFFLIVAALILTGMLFAFGVEQRQQEVGTLLAFGFSPRRVRRVFRAEGFALASLGGKLGVVGGVYYAQAMLRGLGTLWRDAVGTSSLELHVDLVTLAIGYAAAVGVSMATLEWVLRRQARRPARELLAGGMGAGAGDGVAAAVGRPSRPVIGWLWGASLVAAVGITAWGLISGGTFGPEAFFGAGSLALVAGLGLASRWLGRLASAGGGRAFSWLGFGVRGLGRRRSRSLATVALLACGSFLVVSIGANRLDAMRDAARRSSGTGGFALQAESALPVLPDLNRRPGREALGLEEGVFTNVSFVAFRVRAGDDASCLNLNRAQRPRLLGVDPEALASRGAFSFASVARGSPAAEGWRLLRPAGGAPADEIPAIGDAASIQWALGKSLGDTLTFEDEGGRPFRVRLVAALANSILQGSLIIDEAEFTRRFPGAGGRQFFLVDAPSGERARVSAELSRGLQNLGVEVVETTTRLARLNGVQNTYLNTFQLLGGLGLLLGSAGLGVVLLRNALERRNELAVLTAMGFRAARLHWLMFAEHALLMIVGLGVGVGAALLAVVPVTLAPGGETPVRMLTWILAGVFTLGLVSTWAATRFALRGRLVENLRTE